MCNIIIRNYQTTDEQSWLRCRVLSFLDTAYFDHVLREKETYENPAIELVAIKDDQVIGLIDVEYELEERSVCSRGQGLGGMIWHVAVHPDFRREGIGHMLLKEAERIAKEKNLNRLEAWTRDDEWVTSWYERNQFKEVDSYLHVFMDSAPETNIGVSTNVEKLVPIQAFAHYVGEDKNRMKAMFKRVHTCVCYEKCLI